MARQLTVEKQPTPVTKLCWSQVAEHDHDQASAATANRPHRAPPPRRKLPTLLFGNDIVATLTRHSGVELMKIQEFAAEFRFVNERGAGGNLSASAQNAHYHLTPGAKR